MFKFIFSVCPKCKTAIFLYVTGWVQKYFVVKIISACDCLSTLSDNVSRGLMCLIILC